MNNNPDIFRFTSLIIESKKDSLILAELPKSIADKFPKDYSINIEGTIEDHPFRSPLESIDNKRYLVINKFMLNNAKAGIGNKVNLVILGTEPDPVIPADLKELLKKSPEAQKTWDRLTTMNHRDWIRWIGMAKKQETRDHRLEKAINTLSEGKRNLCCVNVYSYMLIKIKEDTDKN